MANQTNESPLTWILLIAWIVFNLVMFVMAWPWAISGIRSEDPYGRASSLLNRVMVVAVVDFIWMGVIVWTSGGVNVESLLCLPVIFLVVLGPVYIRLRRFYRSRMKKGEDQSTN